MAGIYIHIPFCRKACHFCNFHFSTSLKQKERLLSAILKEIELRADYLADNKVSSIYLGGGTPSVLNEQELNSIFEKLSEFYHWDENAEITFEANPDDLEKDYLKVLQNSPVNRLSIGLQALKQDQLEWMNRSHSLQQSYQLMEDLPGHGFENISVDWLYGFPGLSEEQLIHQLEWTKQHNIPHFSAYALTVEPGTALSHNIRKGKEPLWDEELSSTHFDLIMDWVTDQPYEHYEISNFALPAKRAKHNSSYWSGSPYVGIGPSAHSYNGDERQWNVANNAAYMNALETGKLKYELESLRPEDRFNEWIMTGIRLKEGLELEELEDRYKVYREHFYKKIRQTHLKDWLLIEDGCLQLSRKGKHFADRIASHLFV